MRIRGSLIRASQFLGLGLSVLILAACGGEVGTANVPTETGHSDPNEPVYTIGKDGIYVLEIEAPDNRVIPCVVYKEYPGGDGVGVALSCDWDLTR